MKESENIRNEMGGGGVHYVGCVCSDNVNLF